MKRGAPMKRTPMKRSAPLENRQQFIPELIPGERPERIKPVATPLQRPVRYAAPSNDAVFTVPKGEKAKPGKGAPNAEEREWMDWIVSYGCVACRIDGLGFTPPAVHHILRGGRRMGHLFTIPLCDPGHHQGGESRGAVSRHPWKARFEERYGAEADLLARLQAAYSAERYPMGFPETVEGRLSITSLVAASETQSDETSSGTANPSVATP